MKNRFYKLLKSGFLLLLFLASQGVQAQDIAVKGRVISAEDGTGLPGAAVKIKGKAEGTITDIEGNFKLNVESSDVVLSITSVGYIAREVTVGSQTELKIVLDVDVKTLEEIVVVGYGTQKKVNLTGAIDVVSSDQLTNRPIVSTGEGLQGLVPNLNITVPNGDPTSNVDFNIRGYESINGGSPLILVDGVPMDLNRINPEDIKSISVLKDGAAAAIYGARAAFGVILVETKKGNKGIDVRLSSQLTWNQPIWHVEPITNGYEYALLRNEVIEAQGGNPYYQDEYMGRLKAYWDDPENNDPYAMVDGRFEQYGYTAMADNLMSSTSPRQKYDVAISGASDRVNYYTSFGVMNTDGYINHEGNDNYKRYNILMKAEFQATDWLKFDQQITTNLQNSDKPAAGNINSVIRVEPIRAYQMPLIPGYEEFAGAFFDQPFALHARVENGGREKFTTSDVWMRSGITLTPLKNLTVNSNFSYNIFNRQFEDVRLPYQLLSFNLDQDNPYTDWGDDFINTQRDYNQYYVFNTYAEYLMQDIEDHYIKAMVGFNQEWDKNSKVEAMARTLLSPIITDISASSGAQSIDGSSSHATLQGMFFRLNYIFKDRYLFEFNGRYDGTSRFPKGDRFGFFPSVSAGWRISNENFMSGTRDVLDNLKIRASYGSLGNQLLGSNYYPYIPSMGVGSSNFVLGSGVTPFVRSPGLVSPSLTWEKVVSRNFGIDAAFFEGKLTTSFDMYTRETKDMLMRREYPHSLGASAPLENAADLKTKGWEFTANWNKRVSADLSYSVGFNLADWTSEITKYENPTGALGEYYEGQSLNEIWGYETVGIIQDQNQLDNIADQSRLGNEWKIGDIEFVDRNGDGFVNDGINTLDDPGDRSIIGNSTPRYSYGITSAVTYKNFSINLFFQGIGKRDYYPSRGNWTWFFPWRSLNGDRNWVTHSWTPENTGAYFPKAQTDSKNFVPQTRFMQSASYIRLKNVNITYNIPKMWMNKIGLSSGSVYVAGQNLWEHSGIRRPLDPEYIFDSSVDYPLFRSYTVGVVINL
ncbi:MAG: TonB-dependent receptor [Cyclobacteriaceae bacterium]